MNDDSRSEYVVRARGLPWSATAENVAEFFSGIEAFCFVGCIVLKLILEVVLL